MSRNISIRFLLPLVLSCYLYESVGFSTNLEPLGIKWNGFFSTGIDWSSTEVPYLTTRVETEVDRNAQFLSETVLGLNLARTIEQSYRLGAQLLATGVNADAAVKADWMFASYQPNNSFSVTIGKQRLPLFMLNQYINVGRAYIWARPPEEVYGLFPLDSFAGVSVAYEKEWGPFGIRVEPYGGATTLEALPSAPSSLSKINANDMLGMNLEFKILETTKLRGAINQAKWNLNIGPYALGERRLQVVDVSLDTKISNLSLIAEYASTRDLDQAKFLAEAAAAAKRGDTVTAELLNYRLGGAKAYYVTLAYAYSFLTGYTSYGHLTQFTSPSIVRDQFSETFGVNIDINSDSVIKLETKRIVPTNGGIGRFNPVAVSDVKPAFLYTVNYNCIF